MKPMKEVITKPEVAFIISILSPIVAVAVTLAVHGNRVSALEQRFDYFGGRYQNYVDATDSRFKELDTTFTTIKIQLAEIQKDILYIKDKVK